MDPETPEEAAYELGWLGPSDGYGGIAQESDAELAESMERDGMMTEQDEKRLREILNKDGLGKEFFELGELKRKDIRRYSEILREERVVEKALLKATDR